MCKKINDLFEIPMEKIKLKHKTFMVSSSLFMRAFDIWRGPKLKSKKNKFQTTHIAIKKSLDGWPTMKDCLKFRSTKRLPSQSIIP